jgi:glycosyltransferase involved in cell wall biosynthesis
MNILIATGIFPPQIGGPATYSKLLKDILHSRGFSADVVNFGNVLMFPKGIRHLIYFFKIMVRGVRADVIYAQDPVSVGLPAFIASKILRKKFFLKVVGDYAWEQFQIENSKLHNVRLEEFQARKSDWKTEVRKKIERRVARGAVKVIVPSAYLKKIVLLWGVPEENITVIYNGFNAPVISESKEALRKKLGISGYSIISVGRLVPWKGFSVLIDAMPEIIQEIPFAHLFIVGDGPEKIILKNKIKELHLDGSVTLLDKKPQQELFEYIKASDAFILNTAYEGFSHQLLEVMALGAPIITTPEGGNSEIVTDRDNGLFVPYNDRLLIQKAVHALSDDHALAGNLVKNAQKKINEFSNERMIDALIKEFSISNI